MELPYSNSQDLLVFGELIKSDYRTASAKYRQDDELEVLTPNHHRLETILRTLTAGFKKPIDVLDVGCGTGRYFHCLQNAASLVGLDISEEMLLAARHPVRSPQINIPRIQLVCANAHVHEFLPESFDFIYSLGMFGHGCPLTTEIFVRFYNWLRPGGLVFFNAVDVRGLPLCYRVRRTVKGALLPFLSTRLQEMLQKRELKSPFFFLSRRQLQDLMGRTPFQPLSITSNHCTSPLGFGRHLECVARRPA